MKKRLITSIFLAVLTMLVTIWFTGCGEKENGAGTSHEAASPTVSPSPNETATPSPSPSITPSPSPTAGGRR